MWYSHPVGKAPTDATRSKATMIEMNGTELLSELKPSPLTWSAEVLCSSMSLCVSWDRVTVINKLSIDEVCYLALAVHEHLSRPPKSRYIVLACCPGTPASIQGVVFLLSGHSNPSCCPLYTILRRPSNSKMDSLFSFEQISCFPA